MTARETLVERAKKAGDVSRYQVHVYIGANDYLYQQVRSVSLPDAQQLQTLPGKVQTKIGQLTDDGVEPLRRVIKTYNPAKVRETVRGSLQERTETAKARRAELAKRGETIVSDWTKAVAVQDANELISSVRGADNPTELAKSLKVWFAEFPPAPAKSARKTTARKTTARKTTARKTTARKTTARKTTARKTTAKPAPATTTAPASTTSTRSASSTD